MKRKSVRLHFFKSRIIKFVVPSFVISIGNYAFKECEYLTHISIPPSVTTIGEYAFCNCTSLKQIYIPSTVTKIGKRSFKKCTSLTLISIPPTITSTEEGFLCKWFSFKQILVSSPQNDSKGLLSFDDEEVKISMNVDVDDDEKNDVHDVDV